MAENNVKLDRLGSNGYKLSFARATSANTSDYCNPEPMYISNFEDKGEVELQVADQQPEMRRCDTCGITKNLRPTCPLRKQRQTLMSRKPGLNQKSCMERGKVDTQ